MFYFFHSAVIKYILWTSYLSGLPISMDSVFSAGQGACILHMRKWGFTNLCGPVPGGLRTSGSLWAGSWGHLSYLIYEGYVRIFSWIIGSTTSNYQAVTSEQEVMPGWVDTIDIRETRFEISNFFLQAMPCNKIYVLLSCWKIKYISECIWLSTCTLISDQLAFFNLGHPQV